MISLLRRFWCYHHGHRVFDIHQYRPNRECDRAPAEKYELWECCRCRATEWSRWVPEHKKSYDPWERGY